MSCWGAVEEDVTSVGLTLPIPLHTTLPSLPPASLPPSVPPSLAVRCAPVEASCPCMLVIRGVHALDMPSSSEPSAALQLGRLLEVLPSIAEYHGSVRL